jgi:hypothetical protein
VGNAALVTVRADHIGASAHRPSRRTVVRRTYQSALPSIAEAQGDVRGAVHAPQVAFTVYTVDRAGRLRAGMTIDRVRYTDVEPTVLQQHIDACYPAGLTQHGETYLLRPAHATLLDPVVELTCELVRRAEFKHAPARFESVFGCESVGDARTFLAEYGGPGARIFEVETESEPFRADMRCLNIRSTILVTAYGATRYWSQQPTDIHLFPGAQPQTSFWEVLLRPPVRVRRQAV